jgi:hypothetical protein
MATAKYTVLIPELTEVQGISKAVYDYLVNGPINVSAAVIVPGYPNDAVISYAEEIPEIDSHFKQLGTYIAEAINAEFAVVVKEGKSGVQTWTMRNKQYAPNVHAELTQPSEPSPPSSAPSA